MIASDGMQALLGLFRRERFPSVEKDRLTTGVASCLFYLIHFPLHNGISTP